YQAPVTFLVERMVWYRDDQTVILEVVTPAARKKDLEDLPAVPVGGIKQFSLSLQEGLKHKMLKGALAWTVGDVTDRPALEKWFTVVRSLAVKHPAWLAEVDAFRAALKFDKEITLEAGIKGRDKQTASQIRAYFEKSVPGEDDTWVNLQIHA